MWQDWIIMLSVAGALAYLIYRFVLWRRRRSSCANCGLMRVARHGETDSSTDSTAD